jgi:hypothetical protein
MTRPVTIALLVALGIGIVTFVIFSINTTPFIEADAFIYMQPTRFAGFAFLKYDSTVNGSPQFIVQTIFEQHPVVFDRNHGSYLLNDTADRFVWVAQDCQPTSCTNYYVDVLTRKLVGTYNPCPMCICHHGDKTA